MADLVVDVLERRADRADRLVAVSLEVLDAAPDDGQRRPQLVAGVGRELALAAQRGALAGQRLADRDERPAGVDGPEPERDDERRPAPPTSRTTSMTPSVRCSVVRSWTTWTVNVPRCGTATVSVRTRTGRAADRPVVWTSRPLVGAACRSPGSYGQAGRDRWIARADRIGVAVGIERSAR